MGWFCPKCPPCGTPPVTIDCPCCEDIPEELNVDFTGGTLTDDTDATGCQGCNEMNAVFTVTSAGSCLWGYDAVGHCSMRDAWEDGGCSGQPDPQFSWSLDLRPVIVDVDSCKWELILSHTFPNNDTCSTSNAAYAALFPEGVWESAEFTRDSGNPCTFPVTLTKIGSDTHNSCGGSLPTTITLST